MSWVEILMAQPLVNDLGWALVHFVWQGFLVFLVYMVLDGLLRSGSAQARYLLGCAALLAMLIFPLIGLIDSGEKTEIVAPLWALAEPAPPVVSPPEVTTSGNRPQVSETDSTPSMITWLQGRIPLLTVIWFVAVVLLAGMQVSRWLAGQRLCRKGVHPLGDEWTERLNELARRFKLRRPVGLLESERMRTPAVVGWWKPVILLPVALAASLPRDQVEAILIHELAHVRRADNLVNLLQTLVETLLFFHPAVWWISRRVRVEREYCCDDLAVHALGNPLGYARALTEAEQHRQSLPLGVAALTGGRLMDRITRLIQPSTHQPRTLGQMLGVLILFTLLLGVFIATSTTTVTARGAQEDNREQWDKTRQEIFERADLLKAKTAKRLIQNLQDSDWLTRASSARALCEKRDEGVMDALAFAAENDSHPWVRREATWALAAKGDASVASTIARIAENDEVLVASAAVRALGALDVEAMTGEIASYLEHEDAEMREASVWALGVSDSEEFVGSMVPRLADIDEDVREATARSLGWIGSTEAVPALAEALNDIVPGVRENAARSLGYIGDSSAVGALSARIADEDVEVREAVIRSLGHIGDGVRAEDLTPALADADPEVRENAARSLGFVGDAAGVGPLIEALSDEDNQVRENAARSLGFIGDPAAVQALGQALFDEDQQVRENAARSLGFIGDPAAVEPLIDALSDEDQQVRENAARSLGFLNDKRAVPALERALEDPDEEVRGAAEKSLYLLEKGSPEMNIDHDLDTEHDIKREYRRNRD